MDLSEILKSIISTNNIVGKNLYPFMNKENFLPNNILTTSELGKTMDYGNFFSAVDWVNLSSNKNWLNHIPKGLSSQIFSASQPNYDPELFVKLANVTEQLVKYSNVAFINDHLVFGKESINFPKDLPPRKIEAINSTIVEIETHPLEFFNNIFSMVKIFTENNPSVKYSSTFLIWLITSVFIPIIINEMTNNYSKNTTEVTQIYNINTTNIYSSANPLFEISCSSAVLKNHPRDKSKTVFTVLKNEKILILKDSLKWALVIKENSIESGWIRKEYISFKK